MLCRGSGLSSSQPTNRSWPLVEPVVNQQVQGETAAAPGVRRAWLANYYPVWLDGEISGIGIVVLDITDRLAAEEFRSVVMDNMAEGLYALDGEGRLTFMNAAASKMLGWSERELRGKLMHDLVHFQHANGSHIQRSSAIC